MGALRRKGSAALELLLGLRRVTQHPLAGERLCHIQLRRKSGETAHGFAIKLERLKSRALWKMSRRILP
jgi:hypothetical protein